MRKKGAGIALVFLAMGTCLTGCSAVPSSTTSAISADIKSVDVPSVGHVICEHLYEATVPWHTVPYIYNVSVDGTGS